MSANHEPGRPSYQIDDIDNIVEQRIREARLVKNLSPPGDNLVQLLEEPDGKRFVARTYSPRGIDHVEESGLTFTEAWRSMRDIFAQADIPVVRSGIAIDEQVSSSGHPRLVVVSEYLEDARQLEAASTQTKVDLAGRLPGLFGSSKGYMLSPEVVRQDMFVATGSAGQEQAVLVDVDPYLIKSFLNRPVAHIPYYISRYSRFMWEDWCHPEERTEVISAFVVAMGHVLSDKLEPGPSELMRAFMDAHLMSNGVGPEHLQS